MTIARQRFGKHSLKARIATNRSGSFLLGNGSLASISAATDMLVKVKTLPRIDTRFRPANINKDTFP
jgi:hypothetical protein